MFSQTEPCQYCGNQQVEAPWTLCQDCRRTYAKTLHQLHRNMQLLQRVARHEYKLTEPGSGGKPQGGEAPAPVNMHAIDLLDKGIYNRVVAVSGDKIVDYDVNVALSMHKTIDRDMIEIAKAISI